MYRVHENSSMFIRHNPCELCTGIWVGLFAVEYPRSMKGKSHGCFSASIPSMPHLNFSCVHEIALKLTFGGYVG